MKRRRAKIYFTMVLTAVLAMLVVPSQSLAAKAKATVVPDPFAIESELIPRLGDSLQDLRTTSVDVIEPSDAVYRKTDKKTLPKAAAPKVFKVVLDPGHGGKDLGAVGHFEILEKAVALDIALKVRRELQRAAKLEGFAVEVLLTRDTDEFIALKERANTANLWGADLFVSIHLNSSPAPKARGFEVYFLSPEASDPETERLALKENSGALPQVKPDVYSILSDVRTNFHMNESSDFAERMFAAISSKVLSNGRGVRQGPFTVLHGTNMPAVLVEVGYVTHMEEARQLLKEHYLRRVANAISTGIIEFGSRTKKLG